MSTRSSRSSIPEMRIVVIGLIVAACGDGGGAKQTDAAVTDVPEGVDVAVDTQMQSGNPGDAVWAKSYGETGDVTPKAVAVDSAGASLYAGYFGGASGSTINFAGTGPSGTEALTQT